MAIPFVSSLTPSLPIVIVIFILILLSQSSISESRDRHIITFRSPGLYPEGLTWDPTSHHFIVAAIQRGTFHSISNTGVTQTLTLTTSASNLPPNPKILGLTFDKHRNRLLATVNTAVSPYLAVFSLHGTSLSLLFLSPLPTDSPKSAAANGVSVDPNGNAYVTNFGENLIWKVSLNGTASILSLDRVSQYSYIGLNGVVYVDGKDFLLVVQSNTGKIFKVDPANGTMTSVKLTSESTFPLAHGIAVRGDGVVFVVSINEVWMLKSEDMWAHGEVIDKITLESEGFPSSVSVGGEGRVYVVYGYAEEGMKGISKGQEREWFRIEEVRSKRESDGESLWPFVMVGLGLVYFLFWRFQMGRLVKNLDKKHS